MLEKQLRVVVATPLPESLCEQIEAALPRIHLVRDQSLLPPERWAADFSGDPTFRRTAEQQSAFEQLIDSADVLYGIPDAKPTALTRAVRANPGLKWVQIMAAGGGAQVKKACLSAEELSRVIFTTGSGVHVGPLSEFAVFGLLAGAKNLDRLQAGKAAKEWRRGGRWSMGQLAHRTIVVLGMGHIGREIARKLAAFDARVLGVNLDTNPPPGVERVFPPECLPEIIGQADGLVNTLPGTDATFHLVSAEVLAAAKPGLLVASVGRGSVFDEAALAVALQDGRVGFACMDVFEHEPLPADSPLWELGNVVISPHTASNSPDEERLLAELFIENARRYLGGEPLLNVVDPRHFF